jgi:hypothetical protein
MMQTAFKLTTTVLPGHRVEFAAPELPEGARVEVFVALPEPTPPETITSQRFTDVIALLESLPPVPRTVEQWDAVEREFQVERDAWDR